MLLLELILRISNISCIVKYSLIKAFIQQNFMKQIYTVRTSYTKLLIFFLPETQKLNRSFGNENNPVIM